MHRVQLMKTHHLLLLSAWLLLPCAAQSALYIEPRLAHLNISGTPDVGDVGVENSSDIPRYIPMINLGWEITSRINLEVRYAEIDDIVVNKTAMSGAIFPLPPGHGTITVLTPYTYSQKSRLITTALPLDVVVAGKFTLTLTPMIQFEQTHTQLDRKNGVPNLPPIYEKKTKSDHFGGEIGASYNFRDPIAATISYTYSPLQRFDAHFVSAGLRFKF
jgi:hypothetical protein